MVGSINCADLGVLIHMETFSNSEDEEKAVITENSSSRRPT